MLLETDLVYLQFQHVTDLSGRETLVRITGKHLLISSLVLAHSSICGTRPQMLYSFVDMTC